jgi:hypothetical protein
MSPNTPSLQTLTLAIAAVAQEQERATRRLEAGQAGPDEHLAEHVLDLQKALGELGGWYEAERAADRSYPPFEALVAHGRASATER